MSARSRFISLTATGTADTLFVRPVSPETDASHGAARYAELFGNQRVRILAAERQDAFVPRHGPSPPQPDFVSAGEFGSGLEIAPPLGSAAGHKGGVERF